MAIEGRGIGNRSPPLFRFGRRMGSVRPNYPSRCGGGRRCKDRTQGFGPKIAALGFFYDGKKADVSVVQSHEDDKTPVPKCDKEDDCGWTCVVPKPGSQETEQKTITTVGEFVKYCVEPSMTNN